MVKKIFYIVIGAFLCMVFCSSCGFPHKNYLNDTTNEVETLKDIGQSLIEAFVNNDKETIQAYLSKKATASPDLDEGISYIHSLLSKSEIVEIRQLGTPIESYVGWKKSWTKGESSLIISTLSGVEYYMTFQYYFSNQSDDTLIGVNLIEIINNNDDYDQEKFKDRSGIYNPSWGNYTQKSDS